MAKRATTTKSRSNASAGLARYWRQVQQVQRMTGTTSSNARRVVSYLRSRDITTAAVTKRHPRIVSREANAFALRAPSKRASAPEAPAPMPYRDLKDWITTWQEYEGDYDYMDVETSVDY